MSPAPYRPLAAASVAAASSRNRTVGASYTSPVIEIGSRQRAIAWSTVRDGFHETCLRQRTILAVGRCLGFTGQDRDNPDAENQTDQDDAVHEEVNGTVECTYCPPDTHHHDVGECSADCERSGMYSCARPDAGTSGDARSEDQQNDGITDPFEDGPVQQVRDWRPENHAGHESDPGTAWGRHRDWGPWSLRCRVTG